MQVQQRWLRRWGAAGLGLAAAACVIGAPQPALAQSVAHDLISIMEANGQLTPEQAQALREKAALEREELQRQIRDEVQVYAESVGEDSIDMEDVTVKGEKATVHADLADSMKIGGYIQLLSSFSDNNSPVHAADGDRSSGIGSFETSDFRETDGFSMRRIRVKLSGHVDPNTKYTVQVDGDAVDDPGKDDALNINEAYMDYTPPAFEGTPLEGWTIRGGMFKVPTSYERTTSSSKRITIARSHFVNELTPDRQVGLMLYNDDLHDGRVKLYGGVVNGLNESEDDNDPFLWFARAEGTVYDDETDWGRTELLLGGSIWGSTDGNGLKDPGLGGSAGYTIVDPIFLDGRDAEVRYRGDQTGYDVFGHLTVGRFDLQAEALWADYTLRNSTQAALMPTLGAGDAVLLGSNDWAITDDQTFWGFHVMPSFWLIEDTLQAVFKYEYVDYDNVLDASMWGTTVGLNYHLAPKYRQVIRANWVHLEHETDVVTAGRDGDLDQDFFLVEWQTKF